MEDIKEGEYIRTNDGRIEKFGGTNNCEIENFCLGEVKIHSTNIIDLIEVGDFVNGYTVDEVREPACFETFLFVNDYKNEIREKDIKTILTHEQYKQNAYKVKVSD